MTDTTAPASVETPARWNDYVALLKPRVMSLVVFTAFTGLMCARAPMWRWMDGACAACR